MTITIDLRPEQERRLAERAARAGQDVSAYARHLIDRDIDPGAWTPSWHRCDGTSIRAG